MFFVNERWLGGLLTNFATIQRSLGRLRDLEAMATDGRYDTLSKKEIARNEKERRKLQKNLEGIRGMSRLPDAVFVVDTKKEKIAVDEARKLKIPVHRHRRHQLRSRRSRLRHPRQRRRAAGDPAVRVAHRRRGASRGRDMKESVDADAAREAGRRRPRRAATTPRRAARPIRRAARSRAGVRVSPLEALPGFGAGLAAEAGVFLTVPSETDTMATITAADVKKLRDQTGAGMMDCKAALEEANGDFEEATTILRKRGLASAAKKAGRATQRGPHRPVAVAPTTRAASSSR